MNFRIVLYIIVKMLLLHSLQHECSEKKKCLKETSKDSNVSEKLFRSVNSELSYAKYISISIPSHDLHSLLHSIPSSPLLAHPFLRVPPSKSCQEGWGAL